MHAVFTELQTRPLVSWYSRANPQSLNTSLCEKVIWTFTDTREYNSNFPENVFHWHRLSFYECSTTGYTGFSPWLYFSHEYIPSYFIGLFQRINFLFTENIRFGIGGPAYSQIGDVAIGSPQGPTSADAFLGMMGMRVNGKISTSLLYKSYAVDILIFVDTADFNSLLQSLYSIYYDISVYWQEEKNSPLNFMDIAVGTRQDRTLHSTTNLNGVGGTYTFPVLLLWGLNGDWSRRCITMPELFIYLYINIYILIYTYIYILIYTYLYT